MPSLRNPNINYFSGWFFVTFQVAQNKSVFGVVDGGELRLNELGERVRVQLSRLGEIYPGIITVYEYVLMPNHVHAILRIQSPRESGRDLSWYIGRFKSYTAAQIYSKMRHAGECIDIGESLWQSKYYDNLITDEQEYEHICKYIRENPIHWEMDRFGPVTEFSQGNIELLDDDCTAFVASDTKDNWQGEKPRLRNVTLLLDKRQSQDAGKNATGKYGLAHDTAVTKAWPLISTFSSFEEKGALERRLAERLPFVWIDPAGIKANLPQAVADACNEGWGLVISPVPSGTGLNKQRAIWCNRYVLKVAKIIYTGTITTGGTLDTLLKAYRA